MFVNDPFNNDVQLSLFMCYQLHFGGFDGVDDSWEWHPGLLAWRAGLERSFEAAGTGDHRNADDYRAD